MAVITKITKQKKNDDRYNIFLDGKYAFSVDEGTLIKFFLKKGMELDEFTITEIQFEDDIQKAYNESVKYLARRMRTEGEVAKYLQEKEIDDVIIQEVIHKLTEQKYINDKEYSYAYVRTQINTTDKGPQLIKRELEEKKVSPSFIEEALSLFTYEKQIEKGKEIVEKYTNKNVSDSKKRIEQKIQQQLMRKGYDSNVIYEVLKEMDVDDSQEFESIQIQGEKLFRKYGSLNEWEKKQKVKQALFRRGYSLELIEQYFQMMEEID